MGSFPIVPPPEGFVAPGPGHLCGGVALMRGSDGPETATGHWDSSSLAFTVSRRPAGTTTRRAPALPRFPRHALFPFGFRLRVRRVTERCPSSEPPRHHAGIEQATFGRTSRLRPSRDGGGPSTYRGR